VSQFEYDLTHLISTTKQLIQPTTFTLVAKMTTTRTMLSLSTSKGWSLHQMDVKNVFLHGEQTKDIYMTPQGLCASHWCVQA